MASMNSDPWKKSASFSTLVTAVENLVEAHSVADVTSLVSNELPIDTGAAFQESTSAAKLIVDSILSIGFLDPVAWLTSGGNDIKIPDPADLSVRPADISYIRFRCQMNSSSVDARISTMPDLSFYFCLKLPQSTYNSANGTVTAIGGSSIQGTCSGVAQNLGKCFNVASNTPPSTPTSTKLVNATTGSSPAMTLFLSTQKTKSNLKQSYYGDTSFLDTQEAFNLTFGTHPIILPSSPTSTKSESCLSVIQEYSDLCKLSIYMYLCRLNYVGNATVDTSLNTLEVCTEISSLRQVHCNNGRVTHDTPDELFNKFSSLAVHLPNNSSTWSIQL